MQLEVVVTDAIEARAAQDGGAARVELVAELERGGFTPPDRTIAEVVDAVTIPIHVILRPHDDGFVYSASERDGILRDASRLRDLGASAVVFGALDHRGHVAIDLVRDVAATARLPLTFHRAFDHVHALSAAYAVLAALPQVARVLTAGGASTAWEGRSLLRELSYGNTAPVVIAAGGIDSNNVSRIVEFSRVREVHVGRGARIDGRVDAGRVRQLAALLAKGT
jgi:copper homeostasis protein